jgi:hypothetical protein
MTKTSHLDLLTISETLSPDLPEHVGALLDQFTGLWQACETELLQLGPLYSPAAQRENATRLDRFLEKAIAELQGAPSSTDERQAAFARLEAGGRDLAMAALGLTQRQLDAMPSGPYVNVLTAFARAARRFDPSLDSSEIYQAGRNVWTMSFLQMLLGLPLQLTPAMIGYSLIYPYSDNYLDDPAVPEAEKVAFSQRFGRRLAGEAFSTSDQREGKIYRLVGLIEGQYERQNYPQVYASLFAIHRAQSKSIRLLRGRRALEQAEVLPVVFEKGGTSVLADGYLVAGRLSPTEEQTAFAFGVLTQLVDDLEDVSQDLQDGLMTVFSQAARHGSLEAVTNRTLHFARRVLSDLSFDRLPDAPQLVELLQRSVSLLIASSIGPAQKYYSRAYKQTIEAYLPFRFSYLARLRRKLARQRLPLTRLVEAFILGDGLER